MQVSGIQLYSTSSVYCRVLKMELTGVTLIHKTIHVLSVQLHKTSAHCIMRPSPRAKSFFAPIAMPLATST